VSVATQEPSRQNHKQSTNTRSDTNNQQKSKKKRKKKTKKKRQGEKPAVQIDKRLNQRKGRKNNSWRKNNNTGDTPHLNSCEPTSQHGHRMQSNSSGTFSQERRQNSNRYRKLRQPKQGPSESPPITRSESPSVAKTRSLQSIERHTRTNHERHLEENVFMDDIVHLNPSFLPEPTVHPLPTPSLISESIEPVVQQFDKKTMLQHKSEIQQLQAELNSEHSTSLSPPHLSKTPPDPHIPNTMFQGPTLHFAMRYNPVQTPSPHVTTLPPNAAMVGGAGAFQSVPMAAPNPAGGVMLTIPPSYQQLVQQGQVFITQGQYYQQVLQQMALQGSTPTQYIQPTAAPPIQVLPVPQPPPRKPQVLHHHNHAPKKAFDTQQLPDSQLLFLPTGACVRLPNCPSETSGTVDSLAIDLALPTLNHKESRPRIRKVHTPMKNLSMYMQNGATAGLAGAPSLVPMVQLWGTQQPNRFMPRR